MMELLRVQIIRSQFKLKIFSNKWLVGALSLSIGLVLLVIYTPLNRIFKTQPLSFALW
ncbi:MAG: hypothetical protein GXP45_04485 [bacterium]|nr:hypothetical protein [bacterium]